MPEQCDELWCSAGFRDGSVGEAGDAHAETTGAEQLALQGARLKACACWPQARTSADSVATPTRSCARAGSPPARFTPSRATTPSFIASRRLALLANQRSLVAYPLLVLACRNQAFLTEQ